jgi:type IV secretory pathway TrbD component
MSLDALIMLAGFLVAVMPFLGFPVSMQVWIFFVIGVSVIALGIAVRRHGARPRKSRLRKSGFVESPLTGVMSYEAEARQDHLNG